MVIIFGLFLQYVAISPFSPFTFHFLSFSLCPFLSLFSFLSLLHFLFLSSTLLTFPCLSFLCLGFLSLQPFLSFPFLLFFAFLFSFFLFRRQERKVNSVITFSKSDLNCVLSLVT